MKKTPALQPHQLAKPALGDGEGLLPQDYAGVAGPLDALSLAGLNTNSGESATLDAAMMIPDGFEVLPAFLSHVARQPSAIAIDAPKNQMTYAQLDSRANAFVALFEKNGISANSIVPLVLPRSSDLVAAEIAALKLGACFLPIDPDQPAARIAKILQQARVSYFVTSQAIQEKTANLAARAIFVQEAGETAKQSNCRKVSDADLAYIMFTSGSTGTPKGVMISRRSMNHFCRVWIDSMGLGPGEKSTFLASPGFDTSIDEIWPTLASGATISIPDDETRFSPALLPKWINDRGVTICEAPTAVAELLLERPWSKTSLKILIAGGDQLTKYPPTGLPFRFLNVYGPTETTAICTLEEISYSSSETNPSIGFPISETEIYIIDEGFRLLPPGEVGEIIISATGLARGYLNAPDQTADKFVPNPISNVPGSRCYRTGDAGSKDPDGRIFFHGRMDSQVSIRGNRVESGEVSSILKKNPYVEDAFVTVLKSAGYSSEPSLVAYYIPKDRSYTPTKKELSDYARQFLPTYMIPDHFVVVGQLPLNLNGKVDLKLLPTPNSLRRRSKDVKPPANEAQAKILSLWKKVLGLEQIGVDENFFDLGGHSLAAIRITTGLSDLFGKPISLKEFYQFPTIEALDISRPSWSSISAPEFEVTDNKPYYPLSFQQEQVVFLHSLAPSSHAYNSQSTIKVRGPLNIGALLDAVNAITQRHEILRTTYAHVGREPVQVVHEQYRLEVPVYDLSLSEDPLKERDELINQLLGTVFDLSQLPLARWALIKLSEDDHDIVLVEQHIVHDGWTLSIIFKELQEYYGAFLEKRVPRLSELPIQYRDFAVWQREHIDGEYFSAQLEYWKKELKGAPRTTLLPYDYPRPKKQTFRGDLIGLDIPDYLSTRLREFAQANRFTFFEIMFSVFTLLVHKLSREDDVCIGSALANREKQEVTDLIGMFVNVVIIRSILKGEQSFADYVRVIKEKIVEANMNQAYPFPKLIQKLNLPRDSAVNPLFQVMFSFHDSDVLDPLLGDANCFIDHLHGNSSAKQDLDIIVIPRNRRNRGSDSESDERILMVWEFNKDLLSRPTVQRFIEQYLHMLETCLSDGTVAVNEIGILPQKERSEILDFSAPVQAHSINILSSINGHLQTHPDKECVVEQVIPGGSVRTYSYQDLGRQADDIRRTIEKSGTRAEEELIGILLPRGFLQIASQLAVLASGRAFFPIDPATPKGRVQTLMKEARVSRVIVQEGQQELVPPGVTAIFACSLHTPASQAVDWNSSVLEKSRHAQSLAYVIFTSGSTGTPKGVAVSTDSLYGYAARNIADFGLSSQSRVLVYNSPGFDTSLGDIWPALSAGATLFIPPEELRYSAEGLIEYINANRITFADVPTAMAERMIEKTWPHSHCLKTLLVGGEKLKNRPSESQRFRLHNEYGPTETTISATSGLVTAGEAHSTPDIGRPIAGRGCLVLDSNLQLSPIGVEGDLYVYGEGLARGYLGDPALTAERFLPNPYDAQGGRMYRTGDVVKWTAEGILQFCGRKDRQVKIHGFRIELEEISSKVNEVPGVLTTHTLVRDLLSGKREIVSFYVAEGGDNKEACIRHHLNEFLPSYMSPSKLISIPEMPKTLSGKVNEKDLLSLLEVEVSSVPQGPDSAPNPMKKRLEQIWNTLLKTDSIRSDENFFEIGGHSLLLTELQRAIEQDFEVKIPLVDFFECTTIDSLLARIISSAKGRWGNPQELRVPKENLLMKRSSARK
jgi:amino acid adenylation domain-containing protein